MKRIIKHIIYFILFGTYDKEEILELKNKLKNLNITKIRKERIESLEKDIQYHTEEYQKELERCNKANKWVTDLLKAIK